MKLLKITHEPVNEFDRGRAEFELNKEDAIEVSKLHQMLSCATHGLPYEGPDFHTLCKGKDIKLEDGRILKNALCTNLTQKDTNKYTGTYENWC